MLRNGYGSFNAAYLVSAVPKDYSGFDVPSAVARISAAIVKGNREFSLFGGKLVADVLNFSSVVYETGPLLKRNLEYTSISKDGSKYNTVTKSVRGLNGGAFVSGLSSAASHILEAALIKSLPSMKQEHVVQHINEAKSTLAEGLNVCFPQRVMSVEDGVPYVWAPNLDRNSTRLTDHPYPPVLRARFDRLGSIKGLPSEVSLFDQLVKEGQGDLFNPRTARCWRIDPVGQVALDAQRTSNAISMIVTDYSDFQKLLGLSSDMTRANIMGHAHDIGLMMDKSGRSSMNLMGQSAFAHMSADQRNIFIRVMSGDAQLKDSNHDYRFMSPADWPDSAVVDSAWGISGAAAAVKKGRQNFKDMRDVFLGLAQVSKMDGTVVPKWSVLWGTSIMPGWHHPRYLVVSRV